MYNFFFFLSCYFCKGNDILVREGHLFSPLSAFFSFGFFPLFCSSTTQRAASLPKGDAHIRFACPNFLFLFFPSSYNQMSLVGLLIQL